MDISNTLGGKADQLNAEQLAGADLTITIERVTRGNAEQPVVVHYQGDDGRPWKPCKTARRLLARAWGTDASAWAGRRARLFRDPDVTWSGKRVGGIRIRALSHIDAPVTASLPLNRKQYKEHRIEVLAPEQPGQPAVMVSLRELLESHGITIEAADHWAEGKGKPPMSGLSREAGAKVAGWLSSPAGASALEEMAGGGNG